MSRSDLEMLRDDLDDIISKFRTILGPLERAYEELCDEAKVKDMEDELYYLKEQLQKRKNK